MDNIKYNSFITSLAHTILNNCINIINDTNTIVSISLYKGLAELTYYLNLMGRLALVHNKDQLDDIIKKYNDDIINELNLSKKSGHNIINYNINIKNIILSEIIAIDEIFYVKVIHHLTKCILNSIEIGNISILKRYLKIMGIFSTINTHKELKSVLDQI